MGRRLPGPPFNAKKDMKNMKKGLLVVALGCVFGASCLSQKSKPVSAGTQESVADTVPSTVKNNSGKALVVYFSVPETDGVDASSGASRVVANGKTMGSTQYVASVIKESTGGDIFEIKTKRTYPGTHEALIEAAREEADAKARPELVSHIKNLQDYDIVFVGFPNWWYDMPMPLYSFFDEYDFSGKTIIPFCTHGGSRFSDAVKTIRSMEQNATVLDGYAIAREDVPESKDDVLKWLGRIGMKTK